MLGVALLVIAAAVLLAAAAFDRRARRRGDLRWTAGYWRRVEDRRREDRRSVRPWVGRRLRP